MSKAKIMAAQLGFHRLSVIKNTKAFKENSYPKKYKQFTGTLYKIYLKFFKELEIQVI